MSRSRRSEAEPGAPSRVHWIMEEEEEVVLVVVGGGGVVEER